MNRTSNVIQPLHQTASSASRHIADAQRSLRHVFVRDLMLDAVIGIYDEEKVAPQRVRANLDLAVLEDNAPLADNYDNVVCYEQIVKKVRSIAADGHVNLVETLAERFAEICLQDPRVRSCRVRVEKMDVFSDTLSVGVEIERLSPFEVA